MEKKNANGLQARVPETSDTNGAAKVIGQFVIEMKPTNFAASGHVFRGESRWVFALGPAICAAELFEWSLFGESSGIHRPTVQPSFSRGPR